MKASKNIRNKRTCRQMTQRNEPVCQKILSNCITGGHINLDAKRCDRQSDKWTIDANGLTLSGSPSNMFRSLFKAINFIVILIEASSFWIHFGVDDRNESNMEGVFWYFDSSLMKTWWWLRNDRHRSVSRVAWIASLNVYKLSTNGDAQLSNTIIDSIRLIRQSENSLHTSPSPQRPTAGQPLFFSCFFVSGIFYLFNSFLDFLKLTF